MGKHSHRAGHIFLINNLFKGDNVMSGYNGYSMSNNAVQAYEDGEMPLSKWNKSTILEAIQNSDEITDDKKQVLHSLSAGQLKTLLTYSSWHHTSNHYNKTEFYRIDVDKINDMSISDLQHIQASQTEKKEPEKSVRKVAYIVWGGSRNYPTKKRYEETCEIVGNWAMTSNGRKSITANGFEFLD